MSMTDLTPPAPKNEIVKPTDEKAKRDRAAYTARASSDFYGGVGWVIGLLITLFVSIPVIAFLVSNASRSTRGDVLLLGAAVAWWLNPLSLGALGYIFSNVRAWRFWTILGLFVWVAINLMVSASILNETARIM